MFKTISEGKRSVSNLKEQMYSNFLSASARAKTGNPILSNEKYITYTLSALWCNYTGYCEYEKGRTLIAAYEAALDDLEEVTERRSTARKRDRERQELQEQEKRERERLEQEERKAYLDLFTKEEQEWLLKQKIRCNGMWIVNGEDLRNSRRKPMSGEEIAFLRAITDDTGWLVYADWLDDHDVPELGEKIRHHLQSTTSTKRDRSSNQRLARKICAVELEEPGVI